MKWRAYIRCYRNFRVQRSDAPEFGFNWSWTSLSGARAAARVGPTIVDRELLMPLEPAS
jgi:hypothetical protein